jgi:superfamily II RNA helicase
MNKATVVRWLREFKEIAKETSDDIAENESPEVAREFDDAAEEMKRDIMETYEIREADLV